jgi:hypothetical protein
VEEHPLLKVYPGLGKEGEGGDLGSEGERGGLGREWERAGLGRECERAGLERKWERGGLGREGERGGHRTLHLGHIEVAVHRGYLVDQLLAEASHIPDAGPPRNVHQVVLLAAAGDAEGTQTE